jgi:hypothetical protein
VSTYPDGRTLASTQTLNGVTLVTLGEVNPADQGHRVIILEVDR